MPDAKLWLIEYDENELNKAHFLLVTLFGNRPQNIEKEASCSVFVCNKDHFCLDVTLWLHELIWLKIANKSKLFTIMSFNSVAKERRRN